MKPVCLEVLKSLLSRWFQMLEPFHFLEFIRKCNVHLKLFTWQSMCHLNDIECWNRLIHISLNWQRDGHSLWFLSSEIIELNVAVTSPYLIWRYQKEFNATLLLQTHLFILWENKFSHLQFFQSSLRRWPTCLCTIHFHEPFCFGQFCITFTY